MGAWLRWAAIWCAPPSGGRCAGSPGASGRRLRRWPCKEKRARASPRCGGPASRRPRPPPTRSSAPRRWSRSRRPAARSSTGGWPRPRPTPSDTRTSRPWPPVPDRTRRSPRRWTRPATAAHARAANAAAAQFAVQAVTFTPRLGRRRAGAPPAIRAGGAAVPGRRPGTVTGAPGGARHRPPHDRGSRAGPADAGRRDQPGARRGRRYDHRHPCRRRRRARSPQAGPGAGAGLRHRIRDPRRQAARRRRGDQLCRGRWPGRFRRCCTAPSSTWWRRRSPRPRGWTPGCSSGPRPWRRACRAPAARQRRPAPRGVVAVHRRRGHLAGRDAAVHRPGPGRPATTTRCVTFLSYLAGHGGAGGRLRGGWGGPGRR